MFQDVMLVLIVTLTGFRITRGMGLWAVLIMFMDMVRTCLLWAGPFSGQRILDPRQVERWS